MEIVYPRACGVDVHKSFIVAVICISESIKPRYIKKRFSTFNNQLIHFRDWLIENNCHNVCMESTGKYYIPVYNALEGHIPNVVVANPKWVKAIKGEKDDNKDAKWIADLFKFGIVRSSYIPEKDIRILREFTRYQYKLVNIRSSEKNRFQNALTVGNCKLDLVFTDVFGKSASSIVDTILSDEPYTSEDILSKVHGRCKASSDDILSSVEGTNLNQYQKARIKIVQKHMEYVDSLLDEVQHHIDMMIESYENYIQLLMTIPGVNRKSAIIIISELGIDVSQWSSARKLAAWARLAPGHNESAGKKKSVKISKASIYLKPCLVQVAHDAVKDKTCSYYAEKFGRISKRRGKKRAIIAIARKILVAIYHILKTGEVFNPSDMADVETTKEQRIAYITNNFRNAFNQLSRTGLSEEEILSIIIKKSNNSPQTE
ncbi:MAG: IS110 family transposase [[Clostridium] spiroforme]|uniref:IS110 family transposase n=1 Tax=Thomasclavelia spiroformis TaxID=29348 RepID=UPI001D9A2740|nr:IS110 family transposase [Thomasclavelia spiroformis]MBS7216811.1 IS110 family transposase [Thomasclavelia spiroformis]